jgi:hypothetical protein
MTEPSTPDPSFRVKLECPESGCDWWTYGWNNRHLFEEHWRAEHAPKTCAALTPAFPTLRCVLLEGHHRPAGFVWPEQTPKTGMCAQCDRYWDDPIHAPGHMIAADLWREP